MDARRDLGRQGEDLATAYLEARGLTIRERNWRPTGTEFALWLRGELDIVAQDGDTLVFIEVRSRHGAAGIAEESVTPAKQRKLLLLAQAYLASHGMHEDHVDWRVDVLALRFAPGSDRATVNWLRAIIMDL